MSSSGNPDDLFEAGEVVFGRPEDEYPTRDESVADCPSSASAGGENGGANAELWQSLDSDSLIAASDESLGDGASGSFVSEIPARVGEYRILRLIGSGGMGRVYLAEHEPMQRTVALKTLPPERMQQPSAVERFYGEVRAAARLLHPNIVTAFDAGNAGGIHYLAMEYVNGPTLAAWVEQDGPLSIGAAIAAIRDAARGLAHAHAAGIIHRDVKPSNLMRAGDGTIKVVDLGLASVSAKVPVGSAPRRSGDAGRLVGTIAFMSPEQLENPDSVDARSDIYSLGATFYYLLTGRPPYEGEFLDQVRGHRHDPLPELFALRPDVDLRLEHVLHRMMAKRPQDRYGSLMEVIADLAVHDTSDALPKWLTGFTAKQTAGDFSTLHSLSTQGEVPKVMAIDWGMFYASAAMADPSGNVQLLSPSGQASVQHRLALADGPPLVFGHAAAALRQRRPGTVIHCVPLYIGQTRLEHVIAGRRCPAEVLMALQLRHLMHACWNERNSPRAVAITVPSCYDQLRRQAVLQAAAIAGLGSVRLVDRSLAALQSWHLELTQQSDESCRSSPRGTLAGTTGTDGDPLPMSAEDVTRPQIIISVTGNATEVVITRRRGPRAQQLAAVGQWHHGILQWQQKLVDLAAMLCRTQHGFDPLHSLPLAAALQVACERAMTAFLFSPVATIRLPREGGSVELKLDRAAWLDACEPLMEELLEMIAAAIETAAIDPQRIRHALLIGLPTRIVDNRQRILAAINAEVSGIVIDRTDLARGAAACIAGELPGRGDIPLPPQPCTCHAIGLLVIDPHQRRRIRTMIPRGTPLPTRTSRRIAARNTDTQSLTLVESSTWRETSWRSLGGHRLATSKENPNLELTFEVDIDGQLIIRRRDPLSGMIEILPDRPQPNLTAEEVEQWAEWVADLLPAPKRTASSKSHDHSRSSS